MPPGCAVYQMSADVRDLGRTYLTPLSVVGDIQVSLHALMPLLAHGDAPRAEAYAALLRAGGARPARSDRRKTRARRPRRRWTRRSITPLVAAQEAARAIGPDIAIVDEAIATSLHVRGFLNSPSPRQYSFLRGGALGWGMPAAVGCSLGLGREPVVCLVGRRRRALFAAGAVDRGAREAAGHLRGDEQPRIQRAEELHEGAGGLRLAARSNRFIAMDLDRAGDRLPGHGAVHGRAGPADRARPATSPPAIEAGIACGKPNLIEIVIGT